MGSDKALLEFAGVALWRRQHAMLRQAGAAEIFISAREEQLWAQGEHVVRDAVAGGGPLGAKRARRTHFCCFSCWYLCHNHAWTDRGGYVQTL